MKTFDDIVKDLKKNYSKGQLEQHLSQNQGLIMRLSEKRVAIANQQEELVKESDMLARAIADYDLWKGVDVIAIVKIILVTIIIILISGQDFIASIAEARLRNNNSQSKYTNH